MGRIQYAMRLQTVAMAASGEFGAGCSRAVAARRKVPACSKLGRCCRQSLLGCGRALPSQKEAAPGVWRGRRENPRRTNKPCVPGDCLVCVSVGKGRSAIWLEVGAS
jgi:hypothetical protein